MVYVFMASAFLSVLLAWPANKCTGRTRDITTILWYLSIATFLGVIVPAIGGMY